MMGNIRIMSSELDADDGLVITFSDGTTGAYVVEELLELRPCRENDRVIPHECSVDLDRPAAARGRAAS
jgi:hypothetical protein